MIKNNNVTELTAAGGVLYRADSPNKVLLMKRNGFWDLPKGKLEKGESIEECAVREVEEEVGAANLSIERFLCDTYHEFEENGKKFGKTTSWYSMKLPKSDSELQPEKEEGITELKWVEIEKAKLIVGFENLVTVLNEFDWR